MVAPITGTYNQEVRKVAKELSELPGVLEIYTYPPPPNLGTHGRWGGSHFGIDVRIAPWGQKANPQQEENGDQIQKYLEANHKRLGIGYMIYWDWMIEYPGAILVTPGNQWVPYGPIREKWGAGSANPNSKMHFDHLHVQIFLDYKYQPPAGKPPTFGEKPDEEKVTIIDDYFREKNYYDWIDYAPIGATILDVCRNETGSDPLWLSTACALVEQESGGKNIFGCDHGAGPDRSWVEDPPYCQVEVTAERVEKLIWNYNQPPKGVGANGIGYCQLTFMPFVLEAQKLGGAHIARNNMIVGFNHLNDLLAKHDYLNAVEAYNDGNGHTNDPENPYDVQFAEKHRGWKLRLA